MQIKPTIERERGFTLIELIVVLTIMSLLATATVLAFNAQRGLRNLRVAQNELSTNIKKTQSAILSSRDIPATSTTAVTPAKFYALDIGQGVTNYKSYGVSQAWTVNGRIPGLEVFRLPDGVAVSRLVLTDLKNPSSGQNVNCVTVAFAAPFGRAVLLTDGTGNCYSDAAVIPILQSPDQIITGGEKSLCIELGYGADKRSVTFNAPTATAIQSNGACP